VTFLLDHDVPERVGDVLRQEGHPVIRLREILPIETNDFLVLEYAGKNKMILVTCNRDDFLGLVATTPNHGLIVLVRRPSRLAECSAMLKLVRKAGESGLSGNVNFA
jgi:predicted nuclease of predicted toxin-antitoxin system